MFALRGNDLKNYLAELLRTAEPVPFIKYRSFWPRPHAVWGAYQDEIHKAGC